MTISKANNLLARALLVVVLCSPLLLIVFVNPFAIPEVLFSHHQRLVTRHYAFVALSCSSTSSTTGSSNNYNNNENENEYRSISDVVGGLHGGKYQFGNEMIGGIQSSPLSSSDAFSGYGDSYNSNDGVIKEEEDEELPNWAKKMNPRIIENKNNNNNNNFLTVPSNSNPMNGMSYSASIAIQNQERTWEKFYAKIMTTSTIAHNSNSNSNSNENNDGEEFVELISLHDNGDDSSSSIVSVKPKSGFLAPRGGAGNACDASKPYSDSATIHVIQNNGIVNTLNCYDNDLWLVVGTEEEQWSYKLSLL